MPITTYPDVDSIRARLEALPNLPAPVQRWRVEGGIDVADEPAVWIWAYVESDDVAADADVAHGIDVMARQVVHDATGGLWAFVLVVGPDPDAPP